MASTQKPPPKPGTAAKLDIARALQSQTQNLMLQYQRAWDYELGGDPRMVLVGIGVALGIFVFLGCLPWVVSYLQDEGIIKPRVHWSYMQEPREEVDNSYSAPLQPAQAPFGQPRQDGR